MINVVKVDVTSGEFLSEAGDTSKDIQHTVSTMFSINPLNTINNRCNILFTHSKKDIVT